MSRLRQFLLCLGFSLLALFPALQGLTSVLPDAPLDEKRKPIPLPTWSGLPDLKTYLQGVQSWFNDRYPGRNLFIRLKTQLDYSLFSYSDRIYVGPENWLFYRSVLEEQIRTDRGFRPADIDHLVARFRALRDWLDTRGVTLVIIENQMKYVLYPENLPRSAPRLPSPSRFAELRRRLRDETGAIWIDSTAIMEGIKPQRAVFHRTDFHWNDPAAFAVAGATVDRLAELLGRPSLGWRFKLEIDEKPNSGGEASFIPLLHPVTESSLFVRQTWKDSPATTRFDQAPFEYVRRLQDPNAAALPPVLVMGDSFFDGMYRSGFCEHFAAVYRARIFHATLTDVFQHMPRDTRFVVVEFIETAVNAFAGPIDFAALDRAAADAAPSAIK